MFKTIDIQNLETSTGGNTAGTITGQELGREAGGVGAELGRRAGSALDQLKTIYRPPPTFPFPPTFPTPTFPGGNPWDRIFNRR